MKMASPNCNVAAYTYKENAWRKETDVYQMSQS